MEGIVQTFTQTSKRKRNQKDTKYTEEKQNKIVTIEEVEEAINKLKNGKAPAHDKITAEVVKKMETAGNNRGGKKECPKYRGITLLSTIVKVFEQK